MGKVKVFYFIIWVPGNQFLPKNLKTRKTFSRKPEISLFYLGHLLFFVYLFLKIFFNFFNSKVKFPLHTLGPDFGKTITKGSKEFVLLLF